MQVHKWVNVENMMKACFVGPLVTSGSSSTTTTTASSASTSTAQNTNNTAPTSSTNSGRTSRANSLSVPKPIMIVDGKEPIDVNVYMTFYIHFLKCVCLWLCSVAMYVCVYIYLQQSTCPNSCFSGYLNYKH